MPDIKPELRDGAEWADHEDCIVGNEAGLRNLINACKIAIEKGSYHGQDLGNYVGVKMLSSDWFKSPMDSRTTRLANVALGLALLGLLAFTLTGFVVTIRWIFQ